MIASVLIWLCLLTGTCQTPEQEYAYLKQLVREMPAPHTHPDISQAYVFRGIGGNVEQWRKLTAEYFPIDAVDTALCLMAFESGGNPFAYNPSGASGLMQVLKSWAWFFGYEPQDLFDPRVNLFIAGELYASGGFGHWSPWNRGECR